MRKLAVLGVLASLLVGLLAPAASAGTPHCGIRWGSLPKQDTRLSVAPLVDVRAGQHRCFDRLVFDIDGRARGYSVAYTRNARAEGSGEIIPLRGGAKLQVTVNSPAYDRDYRPTYQPANPRDVVDVGGFRTFRQVGWGGSFEGYTTFGLGVRARLPFRVFRLDGPGTRSRLVVDVAHRW